MKVENKTNELVYLVEEISEQQSIKEAEWLLLITVLSYRKKKKIIREKNDLQTEFAIKREAESKNLENSQLGNVVENERVFYLFNYFIYLFF